VAKTKGETMTILKSVTLALCLVFVNSAMAQTDAATPPPATPTAAAPTTQPAGPYDTVKSQYKLTDEQIKSMSDKGLKEKDMARVALLAEKSGKTLDEVMKMRLEDKKGWGKIAKELGVKPGEIGHAVSELRHEKREERKAERMDKKAAREAAKAEKHSHKK
jgi:hypothetical protein